MGRARLGNVLIEEAILEYLETNPGGCRNYEITQALGLHSEHEGKQQDYLTYSVLGNLMKRGLVVKKRIENRSLYFLTSDTAKERGDNG